MSLWPRDGLVSRAVRRQIIVNPTAGSGKAARSASLLASQVSAELVFTKSKGHAVELAKAACREEVDELWVVGGDGTFSEVTEGLMSRSIEYDCPALGIIPAGTGGDYRRTFKITESIEHALERFEAKQVRTVDVGLAVYQGDPKKPLARHFLNVCSIGLGGLTDQIVEASPKWLGGRTAFFLAASRAAIVHQPVAIELIIDEKLVEIAPFSNVAICLGRYFGGGMKIAPDALPDDGLFDIITIEGSAMRNLSLAASIYQGSHLSRKGVKHYRGAKIKACSTRTPRPLLDIDGEQLGSLPLTVSIKPNALRLIV